LSNATSSAIELADLALTWSNTRGSADLSMIDSDLASDRGLETAVLLSLFLDRRAQPDDVPPSGDPNDRRGWWADQFATVEGDLIGSRLWLLDRSVITSETARQAEQYVREAVQWLIDDQVVSAFDVTIDTSRREVMLIGLDVHRPGRDVLSLKFDHVWDNLTV